VLEVVFWLAAALIVYTHVGYPLVLWALSRLKRPERYPDRPLPSVSVIVAARNEEDVIAKRLHNLRSLRYGGELEVIVVSDGSTDGTVERAREAGADLVVDRPHAGKVRTQDAGVERAAGEVVAFTDANVTWAPDALTELVRAFADPKVGYACGTVRFVRGDGTNEEGAYWRYETAIRALESRLGGVTAGNGAIYATRRDAYVVVDPRMGHDLSFPFNMVKRGWRPVHVASARAEEKMVPTVEGEFRRKRRMMSHTWPILVRGGMLSWRYPPLYAFELVSHRVLRYLTPFLHLVALGTNIALIGRGAVYAVTLALQVALLVAAALGGVMRFRPFKIAEYYVLVTVSSAAGLFDWIVAGTPAGWTRAEGTR
jgi:cellulose synthase/poly-beta-1,6-N-acetylglucosamine synthase-like glycosyltransferase